MMISISHLAHFPKTNHIIVLLELLMLSIDTKLSSSFLSIWPQQPFKDQLHISLRNTRML